MKCKTYKRLYKLFPVIRWCSFLLDRHFSQCPACREEFAVENQVDSIGITPAAVETALKKEGLDLWSRVEERLIEMENKRDIYSMARKYAVSAKRFWGWALAGVAVLVLAVLIPLALRKDPGDTGGRGSNAGKNKKIMINFVTVENRPAKTIYFQPENKDRLIVWIKKM